MIKRILCWLHIHKGAAMSEENAHILLSQGIQWQAYTCPHCEQLYVYTEYKL